MNIVSFGGGPKPIPDQDIEVLLGFADSQGVRVIDDTPEIGRQTEVLTGPFRGMEVLVTQVLPARERVKILLEFLGGLREVEVEQSVLAARKPVPKDIQR